MKNLIALTVAVSCVSFSAVSQAAEHCPELKEIDEIGSGVYRADGQKGEWTGVLQGIVADKVPIDSFQMALAIQENESSPIELQYCTYNVGADKTLDMRFISKNEQAFFIQPDGNTWKKENGPFGLIYNICEKTSPENCKFTVHL